MPAPDNHSDISRTLGAASASITLATARLRLEPIGQRFAQSIQRNIDSWEIVRFLPSLPWPYPADGATRWIAQSLERERFGEWFGWALTRVEEPTEAIGAITFEIKGGRWTRAFWVGVTYQGKGYMSEAVVPATDFAFDRRGIERLEIPTFIGNTASSRIKEKMGGKLIRTEPIQNPRPNSEYTHREIWEITAVDWRRWRATSTT